MTTQELKQQAREEFIKEYIEAYKGILPLELLEKGNPWYENFLDSIIDRTVQQTEERVEKLLRYTEHDSDCIRNQFEAGEPTEDGGGV